MAGPLLSLEEAALRCCWCERREPLEPLEPSELYPWDPPLCTGWARIRWICSLSWMTSGVVTRLSYPGGVANTSSFRGLLKSGTSGAISPEEQRDASGAKR